MLRSLRVRRPTLLLLPAVVLAAVPAAADTVVGIHLEEIIQPVTAEYIVTGIAHAEATNADAVLITMNTPGGLEKSMREIVDRITSSKVPVIAYVTPRGSRAASAGFFVLLASDVAVMAPGTTTGAASPVMGAQELPETLKKKIFSDAASYLRSFAAKRGRNPEEAELAVTEAKSWTEEEALEAGLIDLIAASREELFQQYQDKSVRRFDGSEATLTLAGAQVVPWEMTQRQRFLTRLADPNIAFLLFIFGLLGLYVEFNQPGFIVPGVIGGICLILSLFAMHLLPVNYVAVLLILLAVGLFILEAVYTSHGVLAAGGVAAMVLGAMMLVESPPIPELRVDLTLALAVAIPFAVLSVLLLRLVMRSRKWGATVGTESLVGATGEVRQEIRDGRKGLILVAGELWRAEADQDIPVGQRVRVVNHEGLLLKVAPLESSSPEETPATKE